MHEMRYVGSQSSIRPGDDSDIPKNKAGVVDAKSRNPVFALEMIQTESAPAPP